MSPGIATVMNSVEHIEEISQKAARKNEGRLNKSQKE